MIPPVFVLHPPNEILVYPSPTDGVPLSRLRRRLEALGWMVTVAPPQPAFMTRHLLIWPGPRGALEEGDRLLTWLQKHAESDALSEELLAKLRFEGPASHCHYV